VIDTEFAILYRRSLIKGLKIKFVEKELRSLLRSFSEGNFNSGILIRYASKWRKEYLDSNQLTFLCQLLNNLGQHHWLLCIH